MHNRQSGAAHVPIMFFLILLVMFLGALGYGFVQQQNASEQLERRQAIQADIEALRAKETLIQDYIADWGNVINMPGSYTGRANQQEKYGGATLDYAGVMNPTDVKAMMDRAANEVGVSTESTLENQLNAFVTRVNALKQRAQDAELARDAAMSDKRQTDQALATTRSEASARAQETATNLEQARSDFDAAKVQSTGRISSLQTNLVEKDEELATTREAATAREKELQSEIALLKTQLSALTEKMKMRQPPDVADGKLLVADNKVATGFIDLGRKDLLQRGTVFRVKSPRSDAVKGYAEVTRVMDERAEVRLYDFVDPIADGANQGDLLFNDLYTPRVTRTIYLMGRFGAPYGKEQLTNLLRRLGNRVVDTMGPGVDTVVLGNKPLNEERDGFADIEESAEFKKANELRVEFTYLPRIADLIKL